MTEGEAIELLGFHACTDERISDLRWSNGFLGTLRPYRGLQERNFHEVMAIVAVLARPLRRQAVPRKVIASLWTLCHLARAWGVDPHGTLRSNGVITNQDVARLEMWTTTISYAVMMLLEVQLDQAVDLAELDYTPPLEWERHWRRNL